jgi:hypothetical protein
VCNLDAVGGVRWRIDDELLLGVLTAHLHPEISHCISSHLGADGVGDVVVLGNSQLALFAPAGSPSDRIARRRRKKKRKRRHRCQLDINWQKHAGLAVMYLFPLPTSWCLMAVMMLLAGHNGSCVCVGVAHYHREQGA